MDPIELEYPDMDSVPEAVRGLYTEQGDKVVLTGVRGMKTEQDVANVQEALRKEREATKNLNNQLKPWKDMDPEETKSKLDRVDELETAAKGKLDDEGINKIVEQRLASRTAPLERKVGELEETNKTLASERDAAQSTITDMRMTSAIRKAATNANVLGTAVSDVEIIAKTAFELTDDGKLVTTDKSGLTPGLGLEAYFKEMQVARPHWFPQSEGGGAGGGGNKVPGGGPNPFSHDNWNLTEQGKLHRENPELAKQLAKSAGTTVGGQKPPAKKS